MEKEKNNLWLIIVLVLIILGLSGYIVYDKILSKGETTTEDTRSIINKKNNENKEWIYKADYLKENKKIYSDSAKTENKAHNSDKDLIVPYVNINSEYGKKVNDEIRNLYDTYYSKYGTINSENTSNLTIYNAYNLSYNDYLNNNILSLVIELHEGVVVVDGGSGGGKITLYTYNFNLDTLSEANLNEMATKCGFSSMALVTEKINVWEQKEFTCDKNHIFFGVQYGKYFINGEGKLNFIARTMAGSDSQHKVIVENDKEIETIMCE